MPTKYDCLELLAEVRKCASDPESAYVLRTRLMRAVLATGQLAAKRCGLEQPTTPSDLHLLRISDPAEADLVATANVVVSLGRRLCQPSEALDSRWKAGWNEMEPALAELESRLQSLPRRGSAA